MTSLFKVSVVIPVYNAKLFLRQAVESAEKLEEVGEIILVEDGSPDNALEICKILELEYSKVKLFRHENGINKGAGESRNLGIEKAQFNFISFLDADDWYLPNRFTLDKELFKNKNVDGVYGATGFYLEGKGILENELTTFPKKNSPENLLYKMVKFEGRFTTNAITLRKNLLRKTGLFNSFELHEDTILWYKLGFWGNLVSGEIKKPIAIRRVHPGNRISKKNLKSSAKFHEAVFNDFIKYKAVDKRAMKIIVNRYVHSISSGSINKMANYVSIFLRYPHIIKMYL